MKLAIVTSSYPSYPEDYRGHFVATLANALRRAGHTVAVVFPITPSAAHCDHDDDIPIPTDAMRGMFSRQGVPELIDRFCTTPSEIPFHILEGGRFLKRLAAVCAKHGGSWETVLVFWPFPIALAVRAGFAQLERRPKVVGYFQSSEVHISNRLPSLVRAVLKQTTERCLDDAVFTWDGLRTAWHAGIRPKSAGHILPVGTASYRHTTPRSELREKFGFRGRTAVSCVRLVPIKGLVQALRVCALEDTTWVIAGDGPQKDELTSLVREKELHNIRLLGQVSPDTAQQLIRAADVYLNTSADVQGRQEGVPTAVLDALQAGTPVVATPAGGLVELHRQFPKHVQLSSLPHIGSLCKTAERFAGIDFSAEGQVTTWSKILQRTTTP